jgi:sn-glycerol 3-phosphate transport system substrate-binding protein
MRNLLHRSRSLLAVSVAVATTFAVTTAGNAATPIPINVWLIEYSPAYIQQAQAMADQFDAAHPQYSITIEGHGLGIPQDVANAVAQGDPPTIAEYFFTAAQEARDAVNADGRPLFTSVQQAIGGRREILGVPVETGDLLPTVRDYYSYDGQLGPMPTLASTTIMYANTTMLDRAGVTGIPRTWDQLAAACARIAALPDAPPHCVSWPDHGWLFQQAVAQQGALLTDHANGRAGQARTISLSSPAIMSYVDWWQRMYQDGYYLYTGHQGTTPDYVAAANAFTSQQVAFTISSSVEAAPFVQAGQSGGYAVRASTLPFNGEVPLAGDIIGGDALWLAGGLNSATTDGALAFLQYLDDPANAAARSQATGYVPITRSAVASLAESGWFTANPELRVAIDQMNASGHSPAAEGPVVGNLAGIQDLMTQAMANVLGSGADPVSAFTQASQDAQRLLSDYDAQCVGPQPRGPDCVTVG